MINRIEEIRNKGFNIPLAVGDNTEDVSPTLVGNHAFSKIRVGAQILQDATINEFLISIIEQVVFIIDYVDIWHIYIDMTGW